jgi:hypothetical protein
MLWQVSLNAGYLDPNTLQPYPVGTLFQEISIDTAQSIYVLTGIHLDGIGYSMEATSPYFPGVTLAIANVCYYPTPQIIGWGANTASILIL